MGAQFYSGSLSSHKSGMLQTDVFSKCLLFPELGNPIAYTRLITVAERYLAMQTTVFIKDFPRKRTFW